MEAQSQQYLPYDGSHSPYGPPRAQRGCLFYGCLVAVVIAVLIGILIGVGVFSLFRMIDKLVKDYAEDAPRPVPVASLPADQLESLKARVKAFGDDLEQGRPVEPMSLSAEEINALIDTKPDLKGVIAVDLSGDKLGGQVSLPLGRLGFAGRYLNGSGTFDVRFAEDGQVFVTVQSLLVKGKPVPDRLLEGFRQESLVRAQTDDPQSRRAIRGIDRVEVKDGRLIIVPKARPAAPAMGDDKPPEKAEPKAAEETTEPIPGAEQKAAPGPKPPPK